MTPSFDAYETRVLPVLKNLEKQNLIKFPNKKLAIVTSDNPYSKGIYDGLKKSFTAAGWTVSVDEVFTTMSV